MAQRYGRSGLSLGPFLQEVDELLAELSHDELKARLRATARELPGDRRFGFLDMLRRQDTGLPVDADHSELGRDDAFDPTLLDDVDGFVEALKSFTYVDGWDWDPDIGEERNFGDESWVEEMDYLLDRASDAYLQGHYQLAANAYGPLLYEFCRAPEEVFSGALPPKEMIETDVAEAKARYLRALYLASPPRERPSRILEAVLELTYVGRSDLGLVDVAEAGEGPLPDFETFLSGWIEELETRIRSGSVWSRVASRLLQEAAELQGGIEGLAAIADKFGADDPELYVNLVHRRMEMDQVAEAMAAAQTGMAQVGEPTAKARLGDLLSLLAGQAGEPPLALEAARTAWQLAPSWPRLRRLCLVADGLEIRKKVIEEERTRVRPLDPGEGSAGGGRDPMRQDLVSALHLLAGDWTAAIEMFQAAPEVGWSTPGHCAGVVFPSLLLGGAGLVEPPPDTAIAELWGEVGRSWGWARVGDVVYGEDDSFGIGTDSELMASGLSQHSVNPAMRERLLEVARQKVLDRVRTIVGNKHRNAYSRAAQVVVALGESLILMDRRGDGTGLVDHVRSSFSRYPAFRRELDRAVSRSSVFRSWKRALASSRA